MRSHLKDVIASSKIALGHLKYISHGSLIFKKGEIVSEPDLAGATSSCARSLRLIIWFRDSSDFPIPNFHFPDLRDLTCRNGDISRLRNMFSAQHLRTLELVQCRRIAMDELVELLRPAQCLEDLTLRNVIEAADDWPHIHNHAPLTASRTRISLPHLRRLRISELHAAIGLFFLSHIVHPSPASLQLFFSKLSQGAHSDCACVPTMLLDEVDNWGHLATISSQSLYICTDDHRGILNYFYVKLWQEHLPFASSKDHPERLSIPGFFELTLDEGDKPFRTNLLRRLHLTNITAAFLIYKTLLWDAIDWGELFASFSSVRELRLKYYTSGSSDSQLYHIETRDSNIQLPCPRLRLLYIDKEHSDFIPFAEHEPAEPPSSAVAFSHLAERFVARAEPDAGGSHDGLPGSLAADNSGPPSDDVAV